MNYLALALLGIIALAELSRLFLTHRKTSKKAHFKNKLDGTQKMIWDLEFKKFKTSELREQVRQDYDHMKARIASLEDQIKNWPKDKDQGDKARLEDQKVLAQRDADRFEAQLKEMDVQINGSKKTNEYPDGALGIKDDIESYIELREMLKDHIKSI